jgi:hypothetical protein
MLVCPLCGEDVSCDDSYFNSPYEEGVFYGHDSVRSKVNFKKDSYERIHYHGGYAINCRRCNLSMESELKYKAATKYAKNKLIKQWKSLQRLPPIRSTRRPGGCCG